jgi:hypothetical protein
MSDSGLVGYVEMNSNVSIELFIQNQSEKKKMKKPPPKGIGDGFSFYFGRLTVAVFSLLSFLLFQEIFPPSIYYKIYTHKPLVDVNAFAPRDYTKISTKQLLPKIIHNKVPKTWADTGKSKFMYKVGEGGKKRKKKPADLCFHEITESWYKRIENNGWRPVSDRVNSLRGTLLNISTD